MLQTILRFKSLNQQTSVILQFLWVRHLEAAWLGGSSLRSLLRSQSWCWLGLETSGGLPWAEESASKFTPMAVGYRPQFLSVWPHQRATQHSPWPPPEQALRETATRNVQRLWWPRLWSCMRSVPSPRLFEVSHEVQPTLKGKGESDKSWTYFKHRLKCDAWVWPKGWAEMVESPSTKDLLSHVALGSLWETPWTCGSRVEKDSQWQNLVWPGCYKGLTMFSTVTPGKYFQIYVEIETYFHFKFNLYFWDFGDSLYIP